MAFGENGLIVKSTQARIEQAKTEFLLESQKQVLDLQSQLEKIKAEQEKLEIAKRYLLPKQIKEHNFKQDFIKISDDVMQKIITNFTRESGVRGLEQKIATICRKIAKKKLYEIALAR